MSECAGAASARKSRTQPLIKLLGAAVSAPTRAHSPLSVHALMFALAHNLVSPVCSHKLVYSLLKLVNIQKGEIIYKPIWIYNVLNSCYNFVVAIDERGTHFFYTLKKL